MQNVLAPCYKRSVSVCTGTGPRARAPMHAHAHARTPARARTHTHRLHPWRRGRSPGLSFSGHATVLQTDEAMHGYQEPADGKPSLAVPTGPRGRGFEAAHGRRDHGGGGGESPQTQVGGGSHGPLEGLHGVLPFRGSRSVPSHTRVRSLRMTTIR